MLLSNARLVTARIKLPFHRAVQIPDVNDAGTASLRLFQMLELEFVVGMGIIVVAVPGQ